MNIAPIYSITNIKISFWVKKIINIHEIKIKHNVFKIYKKNQILIIKGIFGTATILGKSFNHINLTGIKFFENIKSNIIFFCQTFDINLESVKKTKIDCVSVVSTVREGLKNEILNNKSNHIYKIFNPPKFPGIIIRGADKICITYFNSGKLILTGAKCACEIRSHLLLFNNFINILK